MSIDRLRRQYNIAVQWVAFPLHPETPADGRTIEELFSGCNFDIGQMMERLKKVATGLDLPFGDRRMTYNSRLAQELSKWAETKGYGDQFHRIIFHLYFAEGLNIADPNLLVRSAGSIGLSEEEAQEILNARSFKEAVDADWRLSRSLGITAVPTFVVKESILVGAQPYETLEKFLLREGGMRRAETRE